MKSLVFFGIAFILVVARVTAQYDDSENEIEDNIDAGNAYYGRDSRQVSPYVYTPPSGSCARVSWGRSYCGGFSTGNGGGCDSYCEKNLGYSKSYCFPEYCLCHRGVDFGKDCTNHRN